MSKDGIHDLASSDLLNTILINTKGGEGRKNCSHQSFLRSHGVICKALRAIDFTFGIAEFRNKAVDND